MALAISSEARRQVVQDVEPLLPTRGHHGQHPLHEPGIVPFRGLTRGPRLTVRAVRQ